MKPQTIAVAALEEYSRALFEVHEQIPAVCTLCLLCRAARGGEEKALTIARVFSLL
jgi:hypothetical protein